jgi:hypothetical protein
MAVEGERDTLEALVVQVAMVAHRAVQAEEQEVAPQLVA